MKWKKQTEYTLQEIFKDNSVKNWTNAIKEGEISDFNNRLNELLSRIASVAASEFELEISEKEKILKLMELAAIAGKTL